MVKCLCLSQRLCLGVCACVSVLVLFFVNIFRYLCIFIFVSFVVFVFCMSVVLSSCFLLFFPFVIWFFVWLSLSIYRCAFECICRRFVLVARCCLYWYLINKSSIYLNVYRSPLFRFFVQQFAFGFYCNFSSRHSLPFLLLLLCGGAVSMISHLILLAMFWGLFFLLHIYFDSAVCFRIFLFKVMFKQ